MSPKTTRNWLVACFSVLFVLLFAGHILLRGLQEVLVTYTNPTMANVDRMERSLGLTTVLNSAIPYVQVSFLGASVILAAIAFLTLSLFTRLDERTAELTAATKRLE